MQTSPNIGITTRSHKYDHEQRVWLRSHDQMRRQTVAIRPYDGSDGGEICQRMYWYEVGKGEEQEIAEEMIEGAALYVVTQCARHPVLGFGSSVTSLDEATSRLEQLEELFALWLEDKKDELVDRLLKLGVVDQESRKVFDHFEGCDVYVDLHGSTWSKNEDGDWAVDGLMTPEAARVEAERAVKA